jgi:hypothetical protein
LISVKLLDKLFYALLDDCDTLVDLRLSDDEGRRKPGSRFTKYRISFLFNFHLINRLRPSESVVIY